MCEVYFKHLFEEHNLGVQPQVFMPHTEHFKDLVGCIEMEDVFIVIVGNMRENESPEGLVIGAPDPMCLGMSSQIGLQ